MCPIKACQNSLPLSLPFSNCILIGYMRTNEITQTDISPVFPPSLTSPEVSFLVFWTELPVLGCKLQDGWFLKAAPRVSPGWGPRCDLCKAALVTEYAVPVFEITSARSEAGSGQASKYVFIRCCLSPEVAGSPWVLQVGSRSGSIVPKVSATQRHCRSSQFPPSSSRRVIKGSGISLLLIMEDVASSFSQVLFFPLWRTISLLCALSRLPLISAGAWVCTVWMLRLPLAAVFWP